MRLPQKLFLIGACFITTDSAPFDKLATADVTITEFLARYIPKSMLAKAITGIVIVSGDHISTKKIIWEGTIGQHPVLVVHDNQAFKIDERYQKLLGFYFNPVNYQTAITLWEKIA